MTRLDFGRATEARFALDALTRGLLVSRPSAELPGYDAVVDCKGRLLRVQIKGCRQASNRGARGARHYRVHACRKLSRSSSRYDLLAIWLHNDGAWLFVPRRQVRGRRQMSITVGGIRRPSLNNWSAFSR